MEKSAQSFHLDYGPRRSVVKHPRLFRIGIGLAMAGIAAAFSGADAVTAWFEHLAVIEMHLLQGFLAFGGAALMLHAALGDMLRVQQFDIQARGISIRYSHTPRLFGRQVEAKCDVPWRDVIRLEWQEGALEHDLKQYLVTDLKVPFSRRPQRLKLLVSDHQNADRCEALLASIPRDIAAPLWLTAARLRRKPYSV